MSNSSNLLKKIIKIHFNQHVLSILAIKKYLDYWNEIGIHIIYKINIIYVHNSIYKITIILVKCERV